MSGGSWDYVYQKFDEVADRLNEQQNVRRVALGKLVRSMARAMKAIEWNDSGDGDEREEELIDVCIRPIDVRDVILEHVVELREALEDLERRVQKCRTS